MEINNVISYLIIYSFLGWVVESLYKSIRTRKLVNSGFLYGPICPIYGFGALIMLLTLKHFEFNGAVLFIMAVIILSIWEYIVGLLLEKIFKTKYWDYSNYKFNINGRVCLTNSMFWGLLALIFIYGIHPPIQEMLGNVSVYVQTYINVFLFVLIMADTIFSVIKVYNINISEYSLETITNSIKTQVEKIKEFAGNKVKESETIEKMQNALNELKQKQEVMKAKLEKQTARFRKAFPTMKSMISEKIETIRKKK